MPEITKNRNNYQIVNTSVQNEKIGFKYRCHIKKTTIYGPIGGLYVTIVCFLSIVDTYFPWRNGLIRICTNGQRFSVIIYERTSNT